MIFVDHFFFQQVSLATNNNVGVNLWVWYIRIMFDIFGSVNKPLLINPVF